MPYGRVLSGTGRLFRTDKMCILSGSAFKAAFSACNLPISPFTLNPWVYLMTAVLQDRLAIRRNPGTAGLSGRPTPATTDPNALCAGRYFSPTDQKSPLRARSSQPCVAGIGAETPIKRPHSPADGRSGVSLHLTRIVGYSPSAAVSAHSGEGFSRGLYSGATTSRFEGRPADSSPGRRHPNHDRLDRSDVFPKQASACSRARSSWSGANRRLPCTDILEERSLVWTH